MHWKLVTSVHFCLQNNIFSDQQTCNVNFRRPFRRAVQDRLIDSFHMTSMVFFFHTENVPTYLLQKYHRNKFKSSGELNLRKHLNNRAFSCWIRKDARWGIIIYCRINFSLLNLVKILIYSLVKGMVTDGL